MKLSTSPNIAIRIKPNHYNDYSYSTIEQLSTLRSIGFQCFDFNFVDYVRGDDACLRQDSWVKWLEGVAKFASDNGIQFYQGHGHMFEQDQQRVFKISDAESLKMIERSIIGAEIIGVKWLVWHTYMDRNRIDDTYRALDRIYELSLKHNVGMAIENAAAGCLCDNAQTLLDIIGRYDDERVGVCWDTGHANLNPEREQCAEIRRLGKALKALHVADNSGLGDDHLAPYYGTVNWENVIKALKDVEYEGTFNFEAHNFVIRHSDFNLRMQSMMLLYQIGMYLTNMYNAL